jgi:ABC-type multidrug transport system ATPase subunit
MRQRGCTIVLSTHGHSEAAALATRALRIEGGTVVACENAAGNIEPLLTPAETSGTDRGGAE